MIELLVVIAIIGILASLLLPTLSRAKQKTKMIRCISNFRQIGAAIALYQHDNNDTFPGLVAHGGDTFGILFFGLGGKDSRFAPFWSPVRLYRNPCAYATNRPLYPYVNRSEVFRCTEDKGWFFPGWSGAKTWQEAPAGDPAWDDIGCSYLFNTMPCLKTRRPEQLFGPAGKKSNWVPNPALFILMYEPPARVILGDPNTFKHWHYSRRPYAMPLELVHSDTQPFISPILFADGHARSHDFTKVIQADPEYCTEPTMYWNWYKPK